MSRARERGTRTQSANGAVAAVAVTTGGGSLNRRRTSGAARPAASAVHATERMAIDRRTARASLVGRQATRSLCGPMRTFVFGYGSLLRRPDGIPCHPLGHPRTWDRAMDNP